MLLKMNNKLWHFWSFAGLAAAGAGGAAEKLRPRQ
jgi:hypothetical protein